MIYKTKFGKAEKDWIILVHGLGEHCGRYKQLIKMFNDEGFAVYTFDWPGHGKSGGKRGYAKVEDGIRIIDEIVDEIGEKPLIFGHSLGGLTVIRYAEVHPDKIKGTVASAPSIAKPRDTSKFSVGLAKFLGIILPKMTINNTIDPHTLSRNGEAVKNYIDDPLVHDRISLALARSLFVNIEKVNEEAGKITKPLLILNGTEDVLSPIEGARNFMKKLKIEDKTLREFEGAYHEIFEDPEWADEFHKTIVEWIKSHA